MHLPSCQTQFRRLGSPPRVWGMIWCRESIRISGGAATASATRLGEHWKNGWIAERRAGAGSGTAARNWLGPW